MTNYTSSSLYLVPRDWKKKLFFHIFSLFSSIFGILCLSLSFFVYNTSCKINDPRYLSSISRQKEQPLKNRLFIIARNRGKLLTPSFSLYKNFLWSVKKKCCTGPEQSVKQNSDTDCCFERTTLIKKFKPNQITQKSYSRGSRIKINFLRVFHTKKNVFKSTN